MIIKIPKSVQKNGQNLASEETGYPELDKVIEITGYSYDPDQDIFYSDIDAWQRYVGYCRLYDETAAPLGMIVDCEPVYFDYQGKKWLIEFWKGQYDLVTGCEIGVFTGAFDVNIPDLFKGTFYNSVEDAELLPMSFVLKKNGKPLFSREDKHWWLTGFRLGEFSEPAELSMDIQLTLSNEDMRDAFISGLKKTGYAETEFTVNDNKVSLTFDVPKSPQPVTRTPETDWIIQRKNELLCNKFREITRGKVDIRDQIKAIEEQAPEMLDKITKLGKTKRLFGIMAVVITMGTIILAVFASNKNTLNESSPPAEFESK